MAPRHHRTLVNRLRAWHKWPSLIFTLFILLFALSGIVLNHRELLSSVDMNRNLLPPVYRYDNWNLAAVKGAKPIGDDSLLVFGNIGIWLTDYSMQQFTDFNAGFPNGVDNRKIAAISADSVTGIHAATLFGLYRYDFAEGKWVKVPLPVGEERIVKVLAKGDSLVVMTRSSLLVARIGDTLQASTVTTGASPRAGRTISPGAGSGYPFTVVRVPAAADDDGKVGLFKTLWVIHSGEIYGMTGKLIVDAVGIIFIILCFTGLIYFFIPYRLKQLKNEFQRIRLKQFNRNTLRWHNSVGSWAIVLLILTTITGMFLRPPLLIPIANTRVGKIPYTGLDDPNPWFDRFRDLLYDEQEHRWMVATSEGIYAADESFSDKLKPFPYQPPVSVMGINVFQKLDPNGFLVGSFSGLFRWDPETGKVWDYFTGMPYKYSGRGAPFGELSVAGYVYCPAPPPAPPLKGRGGSGMTSPGESPSPGPSPVGEGGDRLSPVTGHRSPVTREILFDYQAGAIPLKGSSRFPGMPETVKQASPISLWNTALEVHTGRIFQPVLGDLYILVVPVVGLFALEISIVGFLAWWVARRRKNSL